MSAPLLEVTNLSIAAQGAGERRWLVDDVTLALPAGRTLCIVGESGSGKSLTALGIAGLLPRRISVAAGDARLDGVSLLSLSPRALRSLRGSAIGLVFQDPMSSLNPVLTIGSQLAETIRVHDPAARVRGYVKGRCVELLESVGIERAESKLGHYPHQFSGGMRQRLMIAIAIANRPRLLIADEPTTALDVTVQAQVLRLLREVQTLSGSSLVLITHDFGVVAEMADDVAVMRSGRVVDSGNVDEIFYRSENPYTRSLIEMTPWRRRERRSPQ